ncbi:ABC transporter ATP-binding protein [Microvirga puerhi]|uniref:ABC transporter ATP-binding protein n=1 Tax=Microvirga puerhi TaxID=2876078 RepID=A0ABS7VU98_9HYPH|nr:ABC transporter ATP-binding protein [Microvirga puerhi]MBZ6078721.1 ABC transporter ATP-binding protein [Microvirga puerhi]
MSLLSVQNLHAHYGKSHILHGVNFSLEAGTSVALLGRNGSGRSTAMKAIMGLVSPTGGSIKLNGAELAGVPAYKINRAGLAYVPEERLAFDHLTVEENLTIGLAPARRNSKTWTIEDMYAYFPRLKERRNVKAGSISGGEQQMLTLCRSLLGQPSVILIDEPTEGLAPKIVEHLAEVIRDIAQQGVASILVEQKMTIALKLCSRCLIMGHGSIVFNGTPDELLSTPSVRREWLEVA